MKRVLLFVAFACAMLLISCDKNQSPSELQPSGNEANPTNGIDEKLAILRDPKSTEVLVVAHRGDWRNAPENSIQAIKNCVAMGVDMVEIDVRKTKDGHLVLLHDATLDRTTTGKGLVSEWTLDSLQTLYLRNGAGHPTQHRIPTFEEAMVEVKGKLLVNVDKAYQNFDRVYKVLQKTGTTDHVVMKGSVPYAQLKEEFGAFLGEVIYMPVINLDHSESKQRIEEFAEKLQPLAYELVFSKVDSATYDRFKYVQESGSKVWVNSLWESLNGGYEDDMAVNAPDSIYGWYLQNHIGLIQTDRPRLLIDFLQSKGRR